MIVTILVVVLALVAISMAIYEYSYPKGRFVKHMDMPHSEMEGEMLSESEHEKENFWVGGYRGYGPGYYSPYPYGYSYDPYNFYPYYQWSWYSYLNPFGWWGWW